MSMFQDSVKRVMRAADFVKIDPKLIEEICSGGEAKEIKFPAMTKRGRRYFEGVRVQQINPHEPGQPHPFKGGWRYAEYDSKEEMIDATKALTVDMTDKIVLTGLPFAGAKGCLNINTAEYSTDDLWSITNALTIELLVRDLLDANIDVPGPDYGTNTEVMKWIYLLYGKLNLCLHRPNAAAVVTGKPVDFDGYPGREDATARGGLMVYSQLVKSKADPKVAVQGFGNVGANSCKLLSDESFEDVSGKIVAVSDKNSGLYNPNGINYSGLDQYYKENKTLKGCKLGDEIKPEEIITAGEYDLFITAAREGLITKDNAGMLKTKDLLELGNSAITDEADSILESNGVFVIPDILANPGGVVVSYFEWRKNRGDIPHEVDFEDELVFCHKELRKVMIRCVRNVLETKKQHKNISLRLAAKVRALTDLEKMLKRKNA